MHTSPHTRLNNSTHEGHLSRGGAPPRVHSTGGSYGTTVAVGCTGLHNGPPGKRLYDSRSSGIRLWYCVRASNDGEASTLSIYFFRFGGDQDKNAYIHHLVFHVAVLLSCCTAVEHIRVAEKVRGRRQGFIVRIGVPYRPRQGGVPKTRWRELRVRVFVVHVFEVFLFRSVDSVYHY